MKTILILIPFALLILLDSCQFNEPAYSLDGFTDRKEAKNEMVDGEKEGKWIEYGRFTLFWIFKFDTNSYTLTIYKHGVPYGTVRKYYIKGQIEGETHYTDGKLNGVARGWYKNGELRMETHFRNDQYNGSVKSWYSNGELESEETYINGVHDGIERLYHPNGKLKSEITWKNGDTASVKNHPENDYP